MSLVRFCVMDAKPIPEKRIMRGACTCSPECRRQHRNEIRRVLASKQCRLCKRPPMKLRAKKEVAIGMAVGASGAQGTPVNGGRSV